MKPKRKPVPAGKSRKLTPSPSLVEDKLTETNNVGASKNPAQPDTDVNLNSEPAADAQDFERLDSVVRHVLSSFVELGLALAEIRQRKLWQAGNYRSWAAYCETVGGLSKVHANRLIKAAKIARQLAEVKPIGFTSGEVTPRSEYQVRPLGILKTSEDCAVAWLRAVEIAGGSPTARIVKSVVGEMLNPERKVCKKTSRKEDLQDVIEQLRSALDEKLSRGEIEKLLVELETILRI